MKGQEGKTRCWVTLLPFSATGTWIDYVYGFVSLDPSPGAVAEEPEAVEDAPEAVEDEPEAVEDEPEAIEDPAETVEAAIEIPRSPRTRNSGMHQAGDQAPAEPVAEFEPEPEPAKKTKAKAGFSAKLFESLASVGGFYGGNAQAEPVIPVVPFEDEEVVEPPVAEDAPVEPPIAEDEPVEPPVAEDEHMEQPVTEEEVVEAPALSRK